MTESKRRSCPICDMELDEDDDICPVCGSYIDEPAYDAKEDMD